MIARFTGVLVLLAALLQAAPVVPSAVSLRISAAIVSVCDESREQAELARRTPRHRYHELEVPALPHTAAAFAGFAEPNAPRPPPAA